MAREWLAHALGRPLSRSAIRRLVVGGGLRVEGRGWLPPAWTVVEGTRLVAELASAPRREPAPPTLDVSRILYEDDDLIVVDKPPGLPTVATADPARPHLAGLVALLLSRRAHAPAPARLGIHQRLDRDTSGVVLFSKRAAANPGLAAQFSARAVEKTYVALTVRPEMLPPEAWREERPLAAASAGGGREDLRPAVTDFRRLEVLPGGLVVEARPRTGRKHQVRIHLALAGLPILGDRDHGGPQAPRVMLHAARLGLRHPVTGAPLTVTSPWPGDFRAALRALRRPPAVPRRAARRR